MKALRVLPLALLIAACSSVNVPLSPYRIDVQQGNALEQEAVEKLKPGLTRSQVRFLLGTPLLVDPFHGNRWDYVYNFRKAGKLTEERRLVLFFDGDVLARIEAEGMPARGEMPATKPAGPGTPANTPTEKDTEPAKETAPAAGAAIVPPAGAKVEPLAAVEPVEAKPLTADAAAPVAAAAPPKPAVRAEAAPKAAPAVVGEAASPVATPAPAAGIAAVEAAPASGQRPLDETTIVPPLKSGEAKPAAASSKPVAPTEKALELQPETNVGAVKPEVMPEFPSPAAAPAPEAQVTAAVDAWAKAWQARDEEAYLAAYAPSFRPEGGISRAEWEKRRRLLLEQARDIELKIGDQTVEMPSEDRAQVSFRQFYRSDSYRDAVIKRLKLVRVDGHWLIEEEKVFAPVKVKK